MMGSGRPGNKVALGREELWQKDEEAVNYAVEAGGCGP